MGLLENAAEWLESQRIRELSVPIVYLRRDGETLNIPATLGRTLFRAGNEYGVTIRTETRDFLIAAKDLPYIFDRFYRTDASRNSATGGSGIGLSIVKKIIEDHGGKIWATSKEDSGTTMYFVIRKYQEVTANEQNTDR